MPLLRLAVGLSSVLLASASLAAQAPASLRYDRDVRPILADKCFRCHGPDAKTRAAELRLDEREAAIGPRGDDPPAIVPGDPDASELWRRLARDDDDRMPPPDSGKPALTAAERAIVRSWLAAGAQYEPHWSFVPPQPQPVPAGADPHPIDRFLAAARGPLAANPPADAATLCRRLFLVLTGLPPTPEELAAFTAAYARDERAYEQLVDRLLG